MQEPIGEERVVRVAVEKDEPSIRIDEAEVARMVAVEPDGLEPPALVAGLGRRCCEQAIEECAVGADEMVRVRIGVGDPFLS